MTINITIQCCGGKERYSGQCLKERCPAYVEAKEKVQVEWPRMATGYGNAYGEPRHSDYIHQVGEDIKTDIENVE